MENNQIIQEYISNKKKIDELNEYNSNLQLKFIENHRDEIKNKFIENMRKYLQEYYTDFEPFLKSCEDNLTLGPLGDSVYRISNDEQCHFDTIFYKWNDESITYIRACANSDNYCTYHNDFNGFNVYNVDPVYEYKEFWNKSFSDTICQSSLIENFMYEKFNKKTSNIKSFADHISTLPEKYAVIAACFDLSSYSNCCIGEDIVPPMIHYNLKVESRNFA